MRWMMVVAAMAVAWPVSAQTGKCRSGSPDIVRLTSWKAAATPGGADLTVEYENVSNKAVRMIDATAWFRDALGDSIGGASLKRDQQLQPGAKITETKRYAGAFERLAVVRPQDVAAVACTSAVLFEDGETRDFK